MIQKVEMFTVQCDNCKITSGQDAEFSCWGDDAYAIQDAEDNDWIENKGNHYCPDCYSYNDNDELVINESRKGINSVKTK